MNEKVKENYWKLLIIGFSFYLATTTSLLAWFCLELIGHDRRLVTIESSRCTSSACSSINTKLEVLQTTVDGIPKESPPKWFANKVSEQGLRIRALEQDKWGKNE